MSRGETLGGTFATSIPAPWLYLKQFNEEGPLVVDVEKGNPGNYLTIIVYNDVIMITVKPYKKRVCKNEAGFAILTSNPCIFVKFYSRYLLEHNNILGYAILMITLCNY